MKKSLTALLAVGAISLAACGGVDRSGTRDQFIKDIEASGETADGDCVDSVFEDYSDDELKNLVETPSDPKSQELALALIECTSLGG